MRLRLDAKRQMMSLALGIFVLADYCSNMDFVLSRRMRQIQLLPRPDIQVAAFCLPMVCQNGS